MQNFIIPDQEEWRPVVGHEDAYEVSNLGGVRSLPRFWLQTNRWGTQNPYTKKGQVLKPGIASNGYPTVVIGRHNTRTVHSLVADAFIGPCPVGHEVRHRDGIRTNPRAGNLRYGTRTDNIYDAVEHGTWTSDARRAGLRRRWAQWRAARGA